jgi:hypothetical protein
MTGTIGEVIIYNSDQSDKRRAIEENIANHYDISLAAFSRDGTVSTWYDQSGSTPANHATQTDPTKQPKIVDGGTLVTGGIDFDGTDDYLDLTTNLTAQPYSTFSVYSATKNESYIYSGGTLPAAGRRVNGQYVISHGTSIGGGVHPSTEILGTYFANGASSEIFSNGTSVVSGDAGNTANTIEYVFGRPSAAFGGTAKELIIYNTDQSSNRTAIEANIGETYGITAIPAANDTVNGFVQTWYDQSGSGNDAEQTTAANQPKIVGEVTSGQPHAFLGAIEFDGTDDFIKMDSEVTLGTEFYVPMVVTAVSADSEINSTFIGADDSGGGNRFFLATTAGGNLSYRNNNINFYSNLIVSATDVELASYLATSSNFTISLNGTDDVDAALAGSMGAEYIGGGTGFNLAASFREIIIYASDQSANRPAIETNIANQYGITLS